MHLNCILIDRCVTHLNLMPGAIKKVLICGSLTFISPPCDAGPLAEGAFDMISISADEAYEDEQPGILHLKGHFQMQSSDWRLSSGQATVYGSPNRPDRVYLEGSPARFQISRMNSTDKGPIEATARVVEYLRVANRLKLSGDAILQMGDEVIRSANIEYDIDTNRFQAGGIDGVMIEVPPED